LKFFKDPFTFLKKMNFYFLHFISLAVLAFLVHANFPPGRIRAEDKADPCMDESISMDIENPWIHGWHGWISAYFWAPWMGMDGFRNNFGLRKKILRGQNSNIFG
jgi:hypothetical protein